jgi:TrmH family RNA methyltransferase
MGAILNVKVWYMPLEEFLENAREKRIPVYGTLLDGESVYSKELARKAVILLGNESKGISPELVPFMTDKISIPKFTSAVSGIESLNVGMAASVIFSEFARKSH